MRAQDDVRGDEEEPSFTLETPLLCQPLVNWQLKRPVWCLSLPTPVLLALAAILICEALLYVEFPLSFGRPHAAVIEFIGDTHIEDRDSAWLASVEIKRTKFNFSDSCVDVLRSHSDTQYVYVPSKNDTVQDVMPKVTSCNASLCNALQQWAQLARERELQGNCSSNDPAIRSSCKPNSFTSLKNAFVWRINPGASGTQQFPNDPLKAVPLPEEEVERQQSGGVGQICTEGWKRGVLARLTSSVYVRQMLADNQTRMENITAGIDAVCARAREVEDGLLASIRNGSGAATSACGDWPEACWPVPHMPFATLSDFPRRRYLVFAMSEEQLSNARTHIIEAARLAQMSNRILVLPKASRSHLSLGRSLPLCAYWDLTKLAATSEWVAPQLFLLLARAALPNPSVGFMWVQSPYLQRTAFHYELASEFLGQLLPFAMGHVPLEANTLDVKMPARDDTMALTLKAWSNRDVVVWFKTTWERVKFHPHTDDIALPMLPYQKSLHATAERLLARLPRPLIAVHFRSEFIAFRVQEDMVSQGGKANASMVQQRLDWCVGEAERLITSVRDSLSHSSTTGNSTNPPSSSSSGGNSSTGSGSGPSVFIAADVPFNESAAPARSDSWTEMVQWYDGDSRVLKSSSAALHRLRRNVHGTVMIDEIMPEVNEFDPGVVAILDKLVCAHADIFLAGSWACGGSRGYATDIMKHRRQAGYSDDTLKRWAEEQ